MEYLLFDPQAEDPTIPKKVKGANWHKHQGAFMFYIETKEWWISDKGWRRPLKSEIPKEYLAVAFLLS